MFNPASETQGQILLFQGKMGSEPGTPAEGTGHEPVKGTGV